MNAQIAVSHERWLQAQATELKFAQAMKKTGDDWNIWWSDKFNQYRALSTHYFQNVLEVGCGPNTNFRLARAKLKYGSVFLEDPLIAHYLEFSEHLQSIVNDPEHRATLSSEPIEHLPFKDGLMDLVVCINVLGHTRDFWRSMSEIRRVLRPGGMLVLGEDLTNDDDKARCPEVLTDIGHPILFDQDAVMYALEGMEAVEVRTLSRGEGRNPKAHYATICGIWEASQ